MFHRNSRLRLFALWLALSGVLLRGLIPAGFMPGWNQGAAEGGRSWLMICPAGELQALLPVAAQGHHHHHPGMVMTDAPMAAMASMPGMSGGEHEGHRIAEAHLGCPFAAAATSILPIMPLPSALLAGTDTFMPGARSTGFIASFLRRLPAAHGPPPGVFRIG